MTSESQRPQQIKFIELKTKRLTSAFLADTWIRDIYLYEQMIKVNVVLSRQKFSQTCWPHDSAVNWVLSEERSFGFRGLFNDNLPTV